MDAGEALGEDDAGAQIARLQRGVLTRAALAVVVFGHHEPFVALGFPLAGQLRDAATGGAGLEVIVGRVRFARGRVDGADQGVGADVGEVALVFEPGPCRRDGVGRALAFDFVQHA